MQPGILLELTVNLDGEEHSFQGQVVWVGCRSPRYELRLCFADEDEAFRVRMIEQICHIEIYRRRRREIDGRAMDPGRAAQEWIEKFSARFPKLLPGS